MTVGDPNENIGPSRHEVCREYYDQVFGLCLATLRCEHDAADATQLTFERVLRRLPHVEVGQQFGRYVLRTARFACVDVARARGRHTFSDCDQQRLALVPSEGDLPEKDVVSLDTCVEILGGVSAAQRDLLIERELLGEGVSAMARRRGRDARSLSVSLTRARRAAAAVADARGLWGLVPAAGLSLPWLRWRERLLPALHVGPAPLAAAAALLLAPSALTLRSDVAEPVPSVAIAPVTQAFPSGAPVQETSSSAWRRWAPAVAPGFAQPSPTESLASPASGQGAGPPAEVSLPGPVGTLHQERPHEPEHSYGVAAAGIEVFVVETDEEGDELQPLDAPACAAVGSVPGGHCSSARRPAPTETSAPGDF